MKELIPMAIALASPPFHFLISAFLFIIPLPFAQKGACSQNSKLKIEKKIVFSHPMKSIMHDCRD